jgi:glucosyl-3-phosphoglycerate synthase
MSTLKPPVRTLTPSLAETWYRHRTYTHAEFTLDRLVAERRATVSVCLPARNEARTIGPILKALLPLRDQGLIDQLVVVDHSSDGTGERARRLGAEVHRQEKLRPELGPVLGKGDAMWRSLSVLTGELICFLDADSERLGAHYVRGLLGPLLTNPQIAFVKGFYRRPLRIAGTVLPDGGGRVTTLTARPALRLFYPELAGFEQPLAGEVAARRELLEQLPFVTDYGVDVGLLLDAHRAVGLDAMAQVDLAVRQNAHQPLHDLGPMAFSVLHAIASRLARDGRLHGSLPGPDSASAPVERPPLSSLRAAA